MFVQRATLERKRNVVNLTMRPKCPPRCIYDQLVTRDHEWYLVASCDFVRWRRRERSRQRDRGRGRERERERERGEDRASVSARHWRRLKGNRRRSTVCKVRERNKTAIRRMPKRRRHDVHTRRRQREAHCASRTRRTCEGHVKSRVEASVHVRKNRRHNQQLGSGRRRIHLCPCRSVCLRSASGYPTLARNVRGRRIWSEKRKAHLHRHCDGPPSPSVQVVRTRGSRRRTRIHRRRPCGDILPPFARNDRVGNILDRCWTMNLGNDSIRDVRNRRVVCLHRHVGSVHGLVPYADPLRWTAKDRKSHFPGIFRMLRRLSRLSLYQRTKVCGPELARHPVASHPVPRRTWYGTYESTVGL